MQKVTDVEDRARRMFQAEAHLFDKETRPALSLGSNRPWSTTASLKKLEKAKRIEAGLRPKTYPTTKSINKRKFLQEQARRLAGGVMGLRGPLHPALDARRLMGEI